MIEIVKADLSNPQHGRALVDLLDNYARDPMGGGKPLSETVKLNLVPALLQRKTIHTFLAFSDGQAVGLANCVEGFSTFACKPLLNIHDIAVAPDHRKQGIATLLLEAAEKLALAQGCCKITLEVLEGNEAAKSVYTRFGFAAYALNPAAGMAMFWEKRLEP
jgi:hypothetical protein